VTLIGLVLTIEGSIGNSFLERRYVFNTSTNGAPILDVTYVPFPPF
jgi:hypothetical protein